MLGKYEKEYYDFILDDINPSSNAKRVVFKIINDITDRRGIGNEFENIDDEIQEEIVDDWIKFVEKVYNK